MAYARLEVGFHRHPKAIAAGLPGRALYASGLCFCAEQLTNGCVPKGSVPIIAAEAGVKPSVAKTLVAVGLWEDRGDHYYVHDYLERGNPTRAAVLAEREKARQRAERARLSRPKSRRDDGCDGDRSPPASHVNGFSSTSPPSSSSAVNGHADDDDLEVTAEPRVIQALELLGQADFDQAVTDRVPIKTPAKYLAGCIKGRLKTDLRPLLANAADHPDWTAEQLADHRLGRTPAAAPWQCGRCGAGGTPDLHACPFPDQEPEHA